MLAGLGGTTTMGARSDTSMVTTRSYTASASGCTGGTFRRWRPSSQARVLASGATSMVVAPRNIAWPHTVCRPSTLIASITGPHSSTALKAQDDAPSTRTRWWNTSRAITPACSAPVSTILMVGGTRSAMVSDT